MRFVPFEDLMNVNKLTGEIILVLFICAFSFGQTTAFNFQGRLNDGSNPANGRYDLQFKLFDSITGGSQVGTTVDRPNLLLINGVFSTTLDFGATAFTGGDRFVEISVRPNGSPNAHVVLGARQQILSVPFAVRSANATQADNATNAQNAANATNATNADNATSAQNASSLGGVAANGYARLNFANQGDVSAANLGAAGYLSVAGNTTQPSSSNGMVKAMIEVDGFNGTQTPTIVNCYNGVTGASTGGCGFTVTPFGSLSGVYRIDFGFPVHSRFVAVTPRYDSAGAVPNNVGANYRFISATGNTVLEVFTFLAGDSDDTIAADFMVIVF